MTMPQTDSTVTSTPEALIITRVFDAPRELVYRAWTEPERVMRWWGPEPYTSPSCKIDLRVGGSYLFAMQSPEGAVHWSGGVYREIVPNERIVCTDSFTDPDGNVVPASHYGLQGDFPLEMLVTVTLEDAGEGKTRMTVRQEGMPQSFGEMAGAGWSSSLDKLAALLAEGR
jgi:uncharacterized protein YndB with AHSA1/START domain